MQNTIKVEIFTRKSFKTEPDNKNGHVHWTKRIERLNILFFFRVEPFLKSILSIHTDYVIFSEAANYQA